MPKKGFKDALSLKKTSKQEVCKNQNTLKNNKLNKDILTVEELKSTKQLCEKLKKDINTNNETIKNGADCIVNSLTIAGLSFTSGMPFVQSFGTVAGVTTAGICTMSTGSAAVMKFVDNKLYNKLQCDKVLNEPSKKVDNAKYI